MTEAEESGAGWLPETPAEAIAWYNVRHSAFVFKQDSLSFIFMRDMPLETPSKTPLKARLATGFLELLPEQSEPARLDGTETLYEARRKKQGLEIKLNKPR